MFPSKLKSPAWIFVSIIFVIFTIIFALVFVVTQNSEDKTEPLPPSSTEAYILTKLTISHEEFNLTNTENDESKNIYACPNEDDDDEEEEVDGEIIKRCNCEGESSNFGYFSCVGGFLEKEKVNRTDLIILRNNFTIDYASFSENSIKELKKDKILPGHEQTIEYLYLDDNQIRTIENGTFDKFVSLKELNLNGNFLKTIHEGIFTKKLGQTLVDLDLGHNPLTSISPTLFEGYDKLKSLSFDGNKIPSSNFFDGLSNLKTLSCKNCDFSIVMNDENLFSNLKNLEGLHLSGSTITSIPKGIKTLSKLENLEISSSSIQSIEDCDFCELKNLNIINLHSNQNLTYIHENAFGLISKNNGSSARTIFKFSIYNCNLSILPKNLLNWNKVRYYLVERNPYTCNCSMQWLIDDVNKPTLYNRHFMKNIKCYNPPNLRERNFLSFSNNSLCENETSTTTIDVVRSTSLPENVSSSSSNHYWRRFIILTIVIIFIAAFKFVGIYFYRKRVQAIPYQRHSADDDGEEEDKIPDDFDFSNNA